MDFHAGVVPKMDSTTSEIGCVPEIVHNTQVFMQNVSLKWSLAHMDFYARLYPKMDSTT